MRKTAYILTVLLIAALCSCMNNGDGGKLYGEWHLETMTDGGVKVDFGEDEYYFRFQNDIICITMTKPNNAHSDSYGSWSLDGDTLVLNFTHYNVEHGGGSLFHNPPEALLIPWREITPMTVESMTDRHMHLSFTDSLGTLISYTLKKVE